ncbi:MAG TPA: glycosyl hydrolase family 18 protein [Polyangia bacterium]|nr:glycosyl hydrolase family 18 protein [Polyangia bacterium]
MKSFARLAIPLLLSGCLGGAPAANGGPTGDGGGANTDLLGRPSGGDLAGAPDGGALDGAAPDGGGVTTEYAPYFYTWGWGSNAYAFSSLMDMKNKGGPDAVTLAFVLSNGGCAVTTDIQSNLADVQAYVAAGGHVKASFGGADGTYLESACPDANSLAGALTAFVEATGITDLDFDIEQGAATSNAAINAMRASALAQVQAKKGIRVAFTLPVNPDGLDALGLAVVQSALSAGVQISFVNVMTMDYGDGTDLSTTPIASVDATAAQVQSLIAGATLDQAYRMVGATPMIGKNDDNETFSIADAQALIAHAKLKRLGLVSFWAIQRDEKCPSATNLDVCNVAGSSTFQFSQIFAGVNH